jgi:hypothetical protein
MNKAIPFNSAGAYFTGLPANTVLKINYNIWIERFPSEADRDLCVLAKPSADFDPVALEAYARILQVMPIGVPVAENGFGDWFAGGVASIVDAMTGTGYASGLLKWGDSVVDGTRSNPTNQGNSSPYQNQVARNVVVNTSNRPPKPLPPIPQRVKAKPLPPIPQKKKKAKTLPSQPRKR